MSSAQLDIQPLDEAPPKRKQRRTPFALKQQVAERLAAHRARHSQQSAAARNARRSHRLGKAPRRPHRRRRSRALRPLPELSRLPRRRGRTRHPGGRRPPPRSPLAAPRPSPTPRMSCSPNSISGTSRPQPHRGSCAESARSASDAPTSRSPEPPTQVSSAGLTVRLYDETALTPSLSPSAAASITDQSQDCRASIRRRRASSPSKMRSPSASLPSSKTRSRRSRSPPTSSSFPASSSPPAAPVPASPRARCAKKPSIAHDARATPHLRGRASPDLHRARSRSPNPSCPSGLPSCSSASRLAPLSSTETPRLPSAPSFRSRPHRFSLRLMAAIVDGCIILAALLCFAAVFAFTLEQAARSARHRHPHRSQTAAIGAVGILAHPHAALPAALLHLLRGDSRNALRPHRPLHLQRRKPHPRRHAPPHLRRCPLRLPTRASASSGPGSTKTAWAGTTASPACISAATKLLSGGETSPIDPRPRTRYTF